MIVLLVYERPEEVTDMKRSLSGGEVIYSTFDEMPQHLSLIHISMCIRDSIRHGRPRNGPSMMKRCAVW